MIFGSSYAGLVTCTRWAPKCLKDDSKHGNEVRVSNVRIHCSSGVRRKAWKRKIHNKFISSMPLIKLNLYPLKQMLCWIMWGGNMIDKMTHWLKQMLRGRMCWYILVQLRSSGDLFFFLFFFFCTLALFCKIIDLLKYKFLCYFWRRSAMCIITFLLSKRNELFSFWNMGICPLMLKC